MTNPLSNFSRAVIPGLETYMNAQIKASHDAHLAEAMAYSLDAGGKRLRPLLLLATVDALGGDVRVAYPAAAALEFIHTYSLIHDDLPAMDNSDLRRGKPSNHVRFDEATAILAGDALLTDAFVCLSDYAGPATQLQELLRILATAAGSRGMVAGQQMDLDGSNQHLSTEQLQHLNAHKTGALIHGAVAMGAVIGNAPTRTSEHLQDFATAFGLGFQLKDDIDDATETTAQLGKPADQDEHNGKNTYVELLGLDGARAQLVKYAKQADAALGRVRGDTAVLMSIADYLKREK
ncbi:polyprenyl synthetase family protein [Lacticaseibacillus pabuli]|uniref:Polyprenyl synthetase family protein n=1 Tax=Lacticaseibacillus pabuli TaxID=3025672 RepID=A0ABY7WU40_9LACO|nr:farnesyl diphosphate synthase [Lacticaseibacillus sp. KACC 23028]WDF83670.1 polyprenyl synthetase family protein [Lacticaseibacillus sp. KACC 23028]